MEFDVNEWRIAEANARLHELRTAAENGQLSDKLVTALAETAELAMNTWKIGVRLMAERMGDQG